MSRSFLGAYDLQVPTTPRVVPERVSALLKKIQWGSKEVTLRSTDHGQTWLGSTGQPGVLVVLRRSGARWVCSLEDRSNGNVWHGEAKRNDGAAIANLRREVMRIGKAT